MVAEASEVMTSAVVAAEPGVTIAFTFPLGRYHATAAGTAANDGVVEWPPSPWRLLRTLYSVWKTRCDDLDDNLVVGLLGTLAQPPQYHIDPRTAAGHTRHYMPGDKNGSEARFLALDVFVACAPDRPTLYATWPDVTLDASQRDALGRLCDAITWVGRAESLADARLLDGGELPPGANTYLVPGDAADTGDSPIRLLVPTTPLDLEALVTRPSDLRANAKTRSTLPPGASLRTFVRPSPERVHAERPTHRSRPRPTAVRFSVVPTAAGRSATRLPTVDTVVHTSGLRQAALARFGSMNGGAGSATLSGRTDSGPRAGHRHAHYLALPGDDTRVPRDRVESFVVWAPDGFDPAELDALRSIRRVRGFPWLSSSREFGVIADGFATPAELLDDGFCGPSTAWSSVTPVVAGRHPKGARSWAEHVEAEIIADCASRGLPTASVDLHPWEGRFTTVRPRPGKPSHRAHNRPFHATLTFETAPDANHMLCVGAMSHFGLGLFRATD